MDRLIDRTACVFLTKRKKEGVGEEVLISDVKCITMEEFTMDGQKI